MSSIWLDKAERGIRVLRSEEREWRPTTSLSPVLRATHQPLGWFLVRDMRTDIVPQEPLLGNWFGKRRCR